MNIKKDTILKIKHSRKGTFIGKAIKDFNTNDEWYPIVVEDEEVKGINTIWEKGEDIPCRNSLCSIEIIKVGEKLRKVNYD